MNGSILKEKISTPKKDNKILKKYLYILFRFVLCFLASRTSVFFDICPFGPSMLLAVGNGAVSYIGAMVGYYTIGSFEGLFYTTVVYIIKIFVRSEKMDAPILFVGGCIIYSAIIMQGGFLPYSVILRLLSVVITAFSYFPLKKGYKAQFYKAATLKFTKKEGYSSLFLLFVVVMGIGNNTLIYLVNISEVVKIYLIITAAYLTGIGGGASVGAILGLLSGRNSLDSANIMALYSLFGFFSGIFSKFTKITAVLGILCSYVFASIYISTTFQSVYFLDVAVSGILFILTPSKKLKKYFERYTKREAVRDMMTTVNSITASRLEKLAQSFTGLSNEITFKKRDNFFLDVNSNSMFDFISDKVCKKCNLKNICWQKEYENTVNSLISAIKRLERTNELTEKDFDDVLGSRCLKLKEITINCRNFYDILKINAVWKNKMNESTHAFKQQFLEMSNIICELKKNIETNKYFEAELSGELYGVLTSEGFLVKEVFVVKDASDTFYVKLILFRCKNGENCSLKIKKLIEDTLGVSVLKTDGGCGESLCTLFFKEGNSRKIEKRVHNISKNSGEPIGDSYKISSVSPNKYLILLCDGMGSGKEAAKISESVINLTEQMLKAGFSEEATYKMINSFILANFSVAGFSTMDFIVLDTKNMTGKIIKNGACPTYIRKKNGEVTTIKNISLPVGIREQKPYIRTIPIHDEDMIIMVSDGVTASSEDKDWVSKILSKLDDADITKAVDHIFSLSKSDCENLDDITVLGVKIA